MTQDADSPLPLTLNNLVNTCLILRCTHNFFPGLESGLFKSQCVFSHSGIILSVGTVKSLLEAHEIVL